MRRSTIVHFHALGTGVMGLLSALFPSFRGFFDTVLVSLFGSHHAVTHARSMIIVEGSSEGLAPGLNLCLSLHVWYAHDGPALTVRLLLEPGGERGQNEKPSDMT